MITTQHTPEPCVVCGAPEDGHDDGCTVGETQYAPGPRWEERTGQYRTKRRAQQEARQLTRETGQLHRARKATAFRDLKVIDCWTVCLERRR